MQDGNAIEVATIGNEGIVGHYRLNGKTSPHRMIVQIEDGGLRIPARALQKEGAKEGPLKELLAAYNIAFMMQVSQSVACNGLHPLVQRCCRWLLMSRDRFFRAHSSQSGYCSGALPWLSMMRGALILVPGGSTRSSLMVNSQLSP
jgi:hypothetical protein